MSGMQCNTMWTHNVSLCLSKSFCNNNNVTVSTNALHACVTLHVQLIVYVSSIGNFRYRQNRIWMQPLILVLWRVSLRHPLDWLATSGRGFSTIFRSFLHRVSGIISDSAMCYNKYPCVTAMSRPTVLSFYWHAVSFHVSCKRNDSWIHDAKSRDSIMAPSYEGILQLSTAYAPNIMTS